MVRRALEVGPRVWSKMDQNPYNRRVHGNMFGHHDPTGSGQDTITRLEVVDGNKRDIERVEYEDECGCLGHQKHHAGFERW